MSKHPKKLEETVLWKLYIKKYWDKIASVEYGLKMSTKMQ